MRPLRDRQLSRWVGHLTGAEREEHVVNADRARQQSGAEDIGRCSACEDGIDGRGGRIESRRLEDLSATLIVRIGGSKPRRIYVKKFARNRWIIAGHHSPLG